MKLKVIFENCKICKDQHVIKGYVTICCENYNKYDYYDSFRVIGKGIAKCNPTDEYDEKYGRNLAISRAYADAYRQIYEKLKKHLDKTAYYYSQLLCKVSDCINSEKHSIERLAEGIDIYRDKLIKE